MHVAPANYSQVALKVETLRTFLLSSFGHGYLFQRLCELIRDGNKLAICIGKADMAAIPP
jgi:hypothetical protein